MDIYELIENLDNRIETHIGETKARIEALTREVRAGFAASAANEKKILAQLAILLQSIEPPAPAQRRQRRQADLRRLHRRDRGLKRLRSHQIVQRHFQ